MESNMTEITASEFQRNFGKYSDVAMTEPVVITNHGRERYVLVPAKRYRELEALDTRQVLYPHELDDTMKDELTKGYQGAETPYLDHLLD